MLQIACFIRLIDVVILCGHAEGGTESKVLAEAGGPDMPLDLVFCSYQIAILWIVFGLNVKSWITKKRKAVLPLSSLLSAADS